VERLNAADDAAHSYRADVRPASDGHAPRIIVHRTQHGSITDKHLTREFFESAEYRRIAELGRTLAGLMSPGASVARGTSASK